MGDLVGLRGVKEETLLEAASGKAVRTGCRQESQAPVLDQQPGPPGAMQAGQRTGLIPG